MAQRKPQLTPEYIGSDGAKVFVCPSHTGAGESYEVNPTLSNKSLDSIKDPAATWMFAEPKSDLAFRGQQLRLR